MHARRNNRLSARHSKHILLPEDFARYVASFFPGPNVPPATAPRYHETIDEAFAAYANHDNKEGAVVAGAVAPGVMTVTTAAEKEIEERQLKIAHGRIKVPNFQRDGCYDSFYPHFWLNFLTNTPEKPAKSSADIYILWHRSHTHMFHNLSVPQNLYAQHAVACSNIEQLFELASTMPEVIAAGALQVPFAWAKLRFNTIETIGTLALLSGLRLAAPYSVATAKFTAVAKARWVSAKALDYFADLQSAMSEKEQGGASGRPGDKSFRGVPLPG